jgi:hypothetical protein
VLADHRIGRALKRPIAECGEMACFAVDFTHVAFFRLDCRIRCRSDRFFGYDSTFWRHCWRVRCYRSVGNYRSRIRRHWGVWCHYRSFWHYWVCRGRRSCVFVHGEKNATHSNNLAKLARQLPS